MTRIKSLAVHVENARVPDPDIHVFGKGHHVCVTDTRGHATPRGRSVWEIRVDATGGFIPLWAENVMLRYRFQERSFGRLEDPEGMRERVRELFGDAIGAWGDAAPVRFTERADAWDFEIVVRNADDCDINGCVLASAFFPDGGQHELVIYPKMFEQSRQEQVETLIHEIGHIFGLRHFFANVSEEAWPSELFGDDSRFSIMNYGPDSYLTPTDRADLRRLYQGARSGLLKDINGTPIVLLKPFSANRP